MSDNPKKISNLQKLISALVQTGNIAQAIRDANLSPGRAHQILRSHRARRLMLQYRELAALHRELFLAHSSSQALSTLQQHLAAADDPGRQLRSALSLLKFTTPKPAAPDLRGFDYDPSTEEPRY